MAGQQAAVKTVVVLHDKLAGARNHSRLFHVMRSVVSELMEKLLSMHAAVTSSKMEINLVL